jgi:hypothetical protein
MAYARNEERKMVEISKDLSKETKGGEKRNRHPFNRSSGFRKHKKDYFFGIKHSLRGCFIFYQPKGWKKTPKGT